MYYFLNFSIFDDRWICSFNKIHKLDFCKYFLVINKFGEVSVLNLDFINIGLTIQVFNTMYRVRFLTLTKDLI